MNLIYYPGLNCHLACVVNIAAYLGVNYQDAFATLWSETDFADDPKYHVYLSKRMFPNLEALGIKLEVLNCGSPEESQESFSLIPAGELFIVGMDTFHIPWSLIYQNFHEPHYFFARKDKQDSIFCFDPTYNHNNLRIASGDIAPYAFELSRVHKLTVNPMQFGLGQEARNILRKHPDTQEKLCLEIDRCKSRDLKSITQLIRQVNAMINNRHLFRRFLQQYPFTSDRCRQFFSANFLSKWEAVKNGLYKASIIKDNGGIVDEVRGLFMNLIREETGMANEILAAEGKKLQYALGTIPGMTEPTERIIYAQIDPRCADTGLQF